MHHELIQDSSNLCSLGYDPETQVLEVRFKSGAFYRYYKVPAELVQAFWQAKSKGQFLHAQVSTVYSGRKVG
ncbi:MAG TPA: KTSC domain-containing protein [Anaerolineae bacterium]